MDRKTMNRILRIAEKTESVVAFEDGDSDKPALIVSGWQQRSDANLEWNRRRPAFQPWRQVYEIIWHLGLSDEPFSDLRLGKLRVEENNRILRKRAGWATKEDVPFQPTDRAIKAMLNRIVHPKSGLRKDIVSHLLRCSYGEMRQAYNSPDRTDFIRLVYQAGLLRLHLLAGSQGEEGIPMNPWHSEAYYTVPDGVEEPPFDILFDDEYDACSECSALVEISPSSYGWQPDSWDDGDGRLCQDCVRQHYQEQYLEWCIMDPVNNPVNDYLLDAETLADFERVDFDFENGLHYGQNDDPKRITALLDKAGIEHFYTISPSQFTMSFWLYVRREFLEQATAIVKKNDVTLGHDQARELEKALRNQPHHPDVSVTSYTFDDDGNLVEKKRL